MVLFILSAFSTPLIEDRKFRAIKLANNLDIILISDENSIRSSAALTVGAGSFQDPDEIPGLAHLLEHMIFEGSKSYPRSGDFEEYLSNYSGVVNAYTEDEKTTFYFEVNNSGYQKSLLMFSRMFAEPMLDIKNIYKQIDNINNEYLVNNSKDSWKQHQLLKSLANKKHPYSRFHTGSTDSFRYYKYDLLSTKLEEFFDNYYQARNIKLVLLSNYALDDLQELAINYFSDIHENLKDNNKLLYGVIKTSEKVYEDSNLGKMIWYKKENTSPTLDIIFTRMESTETLLNDQDKIYMNNYDNWENSDIYSKVNTEDNSNSNSKTNKNILNRRIIKKTKITKLGNDKEAIKINENKAIKDNTRNESNPGNTSNSKHIYNNDNSNNKNYKNLNSKDSILIKSLNNIRFKSKDRSNTTASSFMQLRSFLLNNKNEEKYTKYTSFLRNKPYDYLNYLIKYTEEGSLLHYLKSKNLATKLESGLIVSYNSFWQYAISVSLTQEGLDNNIKVIDAVFSYLNKIKSTNVKENIFKEIQKINDTQYLFLEKNEKYGEYAANISSNMFDFPYKEIIKSDFIHANMEKEIVEEFLNSLSAENSLIMLGSNDYLRKNSLLYKSFFAVSDYKTENYYKTIYLDSEMDEKTIKILNNSKLKDYEFKLRKNNDYITKESNTVSCFDDKNEDENQGSKDNNSNGNTSNKHNNNKDCWKEVNSKNAILYKDLDYLKVWYKVSLFFYYLFKKSILL